MNTELTSGMKRGRAGVHGLFFCFTVAAALAHDPGLSTATLRVRGDTIAVHLTFARADLEPLLPIDTDQNGTVTTLEFQAARPRLEALARKALKLTLDGRTLAAQTVTPQLVAADGLDFDLSYPALGSRLEVSSELISRLARGHRQYVIVRDAQEQRLGDGLFHVTQHALTVDLPGHPATSPSAGRGFSWFKTIWPGGLAVVLVVSLVFIRAAWSARAGHQKFRS